MKQTWLFDFRAIWAAKRSHGRPYRLMVMLMLITACSRGCCCRKDLRADDIHIGEVMALQERRAIKDTRCWSAAWWC